MLKYNNYITKDMGGGIMNIIKKFMLKGYGVDCLNITMLIAALLLSLTAAFTGSEFLMGICWIPLIIYCFRAFSREHIQRYKENTAFVRLLEPIVNPIYIKLGRIKDKEHKYYNCPSCGQTVSVSKQKERSSISCPVCKAEFIKKG